MQLDKKKQLGYYSFSSSISN